MESYLYPVMEG